MTKWILKGLATGIKTTRFPRVRESAPGVSPGFPLDTEMASAGEAQAVASRCPVGALTARDVRVEVDPRRCIVCGRCRSGDGPGLTWETGFARPRWVSHAGSGRQTVEAGDGLREKAAAYGTPGAAGGPNAARAFSRRFRRSLNILVVDAGDCGACLNEVRQLNNPYYNIHRLGFFITPTPRAADVLLVVGTGTEAMAHPLLKAYEAMPQPKLVIAAGACALSGSLFGPSFASAGGIAGIVPVDIEVPGSPPPPVALIAALLLAAGRTPLDRQTEAPGSTLPAERIGPAARRVKSTEQNA